MWKSYTLRLRFCLEPLADLRPVSVEYFTSLALVRPICGLSE